MLTINERHEGKLSMLRIIQVIISHCIASFDFHTRPRALDTRSILAFSTAISTFVRLWHLISNYVHCWSAPSIDIRWSNTYNYIAYLNVINMFRVRILFNASYAYRVNEPCFIPDTKILKFKFFTAFLFELFIKLIVSNYISLRLTWSFYLLNSDKK